MSLDPRWLLVQRLTDALRRIVDDMKYSIPPLDDFEAELFKARWFLDEIQNVVADVRREERKNNIRLVFGNPTKLLE